MVHLLNLHFWHSHLDGYAWNVESPFEFRALEVALEAICSFLDARTTELETDAYPALDELTSKVFQICYLFQLCIFLIVFTVDCQEPISSNHCEINRSPQIQQKYLDKKEEKERTEF